MFLISGARFYITGLFLFAICLSGCSASDVALDTSSHAGLIEKDLAELQTASGENDVYRLSLQDAIDRAMEKNLDARVAALESLVQDKNVTLEKLKALPSVEVSTTYQGRSNDGATSSRSVITGQESLEPSQSTEKNRRTAELEMNWNLLDSVLAFIDARTAQDETRISLERQKKVMQNIRRDVTSAYWRTAAYLQSRQETEKLLKAIENQNELMNQAVSASLLSGQEAAKRKAEILRQKQELLTTQQNLKLAEIELKSLVSIPLEAQLVLEDNPGQVNPNVHDFLSRDIETLEELALLNRPEMREEILQKNISMRNTRRQIAETFPGVELFLSLNYDSNEFLEDHTWAQYSTSLVQSILDLITLPVRYDQAKKEELLSDARRQALTAAILAQVHIGYTRLALAQENYDAAQEVYQLNRKIAQASAQEKQTGFVSGEQVLLAELQMHSAYMQSLQQMAALKDAQASFVNTLGLGGRGQHAAL